MPVEGITQDTQPDSSIKRLYQGFPTITSQCGQAFPSTVCCTRTDTAAEESESLV